MCFIRNSFFHEIKLFHTFCCYSKGKKRVFDNVEFTKFFDFFSFLSIKIGTNDLKNFLLFLSKEKKFPLFKLISRISCYYYKERFSLLCSRFFYFSKNKIVVLTNDLTNFLLPFLCKEKNSLCPY